MRRSTWILYTKRCVDRVLRADSGTDGRRIYTISWEKSGFHLQEQKADLVIIDDNAAKKTAKYLGLTVTGTLGVLIKAKRQGIIDSLYPFLAEMKQNGFYIDPMLEEMVLQQAGER